MISIGSNGNQIAYGIKHYNLDTLDDLAKLAARKEQMGCTCFIIQTSQYFMLNSSYEWVEITPFGKEISSGGGSGDNPNPPEDSDDIIYEGGLV